MRAGLLLLAACGGGTEQPQPVVDALAGAHLTVQVMGPTSVANRTTQDFTVLLSNDGDATTGVIGASLADAAGFTIATNACTTLAPGASCAISVAFAPKTEGHVAATLSAIAAPGGSVTAPLVATVTQGNDLSIAPGGFAFPDTAVGTTSVSQSGTVTNVGVHALGPVAITSGDPRFAITTACAMLDPGASCAYQIAFSPTTTTANQVTTIAATAAPLGMAFTKAEGYGATLIATPIIALAPATQVGTISPAQTITVQNSQAFAIGPLVTDASALQPFRLTQDDCAGVTLQPGATCAYGVELVPTVAGPVTSALGVSAPDQGTLHNTVTVILEGSGS